MVKFGIIGAGGISAAFAKAAAVTEGVQIAAVAAQDMKRAQRFAAEHRIPHAFGNYAQILSDRSVDAVYIGNTTNFHYNCIKMCLAAGNDRDIRILTKRFTKFLDQIEGLDTGINDEEEDLL